MADEGEPPAVPELLARIKELEEGISGLRHDVRGMLSPGMLMADTLLNHPEPKVARVGAIVNSMIGRITTRLNATRDLVASKNTTSVG